MSRPAAADGRRQNGRPVSFYEYRGSDFTAEKIWPDCGTYAGWNNHIRSKEPVCDACKAFRRDYQRAYRRAGRDRWVNEQLGGCVRGLGWPR